MKRAKHRSSAKKLLAVILSLTLITSLAVPVLSFAAQSNNNSNKSSSSQQPPEKPDGQSNQGQPPSGQAPAGQKPSGQNSSGQTPSGENGQPPSGNLNGKGGANTQNYDYSGTYSATLNANGKSLNLNNESASATNSSSNVGLAQNNGKLTINGTTLNKTGDDENGDNCNFYGVNSVLLSVGESSKILFANSKIDSDATGANGLFATNHGTIFANAFTINSSKDNSRGLDATYAGTIIANAGSISTKGAHSASIATDRGNGYISVANSSLSTSGEGSPLFYSTGTLEANKVSGISSASQIACIEGLNSLLLSNSSLESKQTSDSGDGIANAIMVYQSTSGDADASTQQTARFQTYNSTLKSAIQDGSFFYFTNTNANVVLSKTTLDYDSSSNSLINVSGNSGTKNWGTVGDNGATVSFTARDQKLSGDISVDSISSLDFYILDSSEYSGATFISTNGNANSQAETKSPLTVNISSDSTWVVTDDCTVSNLNAEDGAKIVDNNGKTVSIIKDNETLVKGDSSYSVTVNSSYSNKVETSTNQELQNASIDRSDFDKEYNIETAFDGISESKVPEQISASDSDTPAILVGTCVALIVIAIICLVAYKTSAKRNKKNSNDGCGESEDLDNDKHSKEKSDTANETQEANGKSSSSEKQLDTVDKTQVTSDTVTGPAITKEEPTVSNKSQGVPDESAGAKCNEDTEEN